MAKDDRLYARFDINMDEHPKIFLLSDAAFRALVESTMYSRRQLSDGAIPKALVLRKWGQAVLDELTANDPDKPSWFLSTRNGIEVVMIHDFEKHQTTTGDIEAKRAAGKKGAEARWNRGKDTEPIAGGIAGAIGEPSDKHATPMAITETETETSNPLNPPKGEKEETGKGTRLSDEWHPSAEDIKAVQEQCPGFNYEREHLNFVDYWQSKPGAGGRKVSWSRTWRSWMRNAYDRLPAHAKPTQVRKVKKF